MNTEELLRAPVIPKRIFNSAIGVNNSQSYATSTVNFVDISSDDDSLGELDIDNDFLEEEENEIDFVFSQISFTEKISSAQDVLSLEKRHFFVTR